MKKVELTFNFNYFVLLSFLQKIENNLLSWTILLQKVQISVEKNDTGKDTKRRHGNLYFDKDRPFHRILNKVL